MVGFITERELHQAEEAFPGILRFFESLIRKPRTFLNLVAMFERWDARTAPMQRAAQSAWSLRAWPFRYQLTPAPASRPRWSASVTSAGSVPSRANS